MYSPVTKIMLKCNVSFRLTSSKVSVMTSNFYQIAAIEDTYFKYIIISYYQRGIFINSQNYKNDKKYNISILRAIFILFVIIVQSTYRICKIKQLNNVRNVIAFYKYLLEKCNWKKRGRKEKGKGELSKVRNSNHNNKYYLLKCKVCF